MELKFSFVLYLMAVVWSCWATSEKPLTVVLRSRWDYTPLLLETSEFLWEHDKPLFWRFVNHTCATSHFTEGSSEKDEYEFAVDTVEQFLSSSTHNIFLLSLSLRSHSPAVQMFYQMSEEAYRSAESTLGEECKESGVFVEVNGQPACTVEDLRHLISQSQGAEVGPEVYSFDHTFPVWPSTAPLVVLYAQLGTQACATFHSVLAQLAGEGAIRYIFRHYVKERSTRHLYLSGYGVKLSVKSTEYKAVDDTKVNGEEVHVELAEEEDKDVSGFNMGTLIGRHPNLRSQLKEFKEHLEHGAREMPELKLWQLQDLGFQAAQKVVAAGPDLGLKVTKDIAQNLPTQAKQLYKVQVTSALRKEILSNQRALSALGIGPGQCVVLLNGIILRNDEVDIFQLLEVLQSESKVLDDLVRLGIHSQWHVPLLGLSVHSSESKSIVIDVRSKEVIFINNLEKDIQYRGWPKSLREFLRPTYPGMLRQIGRNVFHIVFMMDPVSGASSELLEYIQLFLDHTVPATLGILLVPQLYNDVAMEICHAFSYTVKTFTARDAFKWLVQAQNMSVMSPGIGVNDIHSLYGKVFSKKMSGVTLDEVFQVSTYCKDARQFFLSKGFGSVPQVLVNGVQIDLEQEELESAIVTRMHQQTFELQQAIFNNRLKDKDDVYKFFLDRPSVLQRVNRHILSSSKILDLTQQPDDSIFRSSSGEVEIIGSVTSNIQYLYLPEGEFTVKKLSVWLVVDLSSPQGRKLVLNALQYLMTTEHVQVGVVHVSECVLSRSMVAALSGGWPMSKTLSVIQQILLLDTYDIDSVVGMAETLEVKGPKFRTQIESSEVTNVLESHVKFCTSVLKLEQGQNMLISNGKLIGPLSGDEDFTVDDWKMLVDMETEEYARDLSGVIENVEVIGLLPDEDTPSYRSELLMKIASLLRSAPKRRRLAELPSLANKHSGLHLSARDPERSLRIIAVLDPLSPDTQHLAPVLQTLHAALSLELSIYFNPVEKLSEIPIKTFYRYLLDPELSFHDDGSLREDAVVSFSALPTSPLLTLSLDVPHSWLVEPVFSPHDLDNIHLGSLLEDAAVHAQFTLEHILVEGQCFDGDSDQPTPGLQFVLGSAGCPDCFDTIVMANLGYFQLKAGPGAWRLRLRPGPSQEIYSIHSYSDKMGSMAETNGSDVSIDVRSFRGAAMVIKVKKRPGMEKVNLLASEGQNQKTDSPGEADSNIWDTLSSFLQSGGDPSSSGSESTHHTPFNETINIFSIASGHLYERFLRIMMLSVVKHTRNPVKFWFLKNYLSPTFKDFIPHMAAHYGFQVELVEYKWPRWLHAQKEKQRLIWGYKILFLDVLFPLHVKKIIFVDADQIVRTDLKELLDEPLDGAPYAYTPFCDSRPDMKGFRFWDSGYWKSHLGNRRYHISALYVVDLVTFRQMAAGDRLRGQYQALSQDPNSLSNLDQDLPNNMIHSVPIKSLPQDWLWCETWCSQESKASAKTIDLCNNPMTKEPKLDSAMRIVPEWTSYDLEIKELWEEFRKTGGNKTKPQVSASDKEEREPAGDIHEEL